MSECLLWKGKYFANGYGRVGYKLAHRIAYEKAHGRIPPELQIDHLCRNRGCVNPEHLEAVTLVTNVMRGNSPLAINARKTHCSKGHEFTKDNTYYRPDRTNRRDCRVCRREAVNRYKAKKRG